MWIKQGGVKQNETLECPAREPGAKNDPMQRARFTLGKRRRQGGMAAVTPKPGEMAPAIPGYTQNDSGIF